MCGEGGLQQSTRSGHAHLLVTASDLWSKIPLASNLRGGGLEGGEAEGPCAGIDESTGVKMRENEWMDSAMLRKENGVN